MLVNDMRYETSEELLGFIEKSPSGFHAVASMKEILTVEGFREIKESEEWKLEAGGKYFVTRNDSSIVAFAVPLKKWNGWHIMASHSDSPSFKIKENPEISVADHYVKLNVERYGGMICSAWFDRPLSVAGRIAVEQDGEIVSRLVDIKRDLLMIPNLAIHMNREINDGYKYNAQKDLLPLFGGADAAGMFMKLVADAAEVAVEDILGHDLFLYNRERGRIWGAKNEYISASRLDDLQCAFASLKGFLAGEKQEHMAVHCVLDNEEVGSGTKQGAGSTLLYDTLVRINKALGGDYETYLRKLSQSFMISADNAHAVHPNHTEKADPVNQPFLNDGIVVKYSANQKYCTDGISAAMFKQWCKETEVPYQIFTNRSDMIGGSTLGNIASSHVAVNAVDIGLPQLAMHSPYETAGRKDTEYLIRVAAGFFR